MTETYLYHHGILGQKWGVRRFQNPDGTLTEAGKKHYSFKERIDIDKERIELENHLRNKYLEESPEFKRYSKMANEFEEKCLNKYGFRPDENGRVWKNTETIDGYVTEDDFEPRTKIEKEAVTKYMEYSNKAYKAAKIPNAKAQEEAKRYIEEKYGNKMIEQLQKDNNHIIGAACVASLAMAAAQFVLVGFGIHGVKRLIG